MGAKGAEVTSERYALEETFPEADALFGITVPGIDEVKGSCDVVLDTNVLLLPYSTAKDSLKQMERVYRSLHERLFIPAQVAREFARHRAPKLAELCRILANKRSTVQEPSIDSYPLFEALPEYERAKSLETELRGKIKEYRDAITDLLSAIGRWGWDDPVSSMYRSLFSPQTIWTPSVGMADVRERLAFRYANKIPPGYKDGAKDDDGIGDLLIWLTILDIAAKRKRPLLFVTGDEKPDWQHVVEKRGLLPRFELVDEFRRASGGAAFHICRFSQLLELFGAPQQVVTEVKGQERLDWRSIFDDDALAKVVDVPCPFCGTITTCSVGEQVGDSAHPRCEKCGERFHAHRAGGGAILSRRPGGHPNQHLDAVAVAVACPFCFEPVAVAIGSHGGASAVPTCEACRSGFHVHRRYDGHVFARKPGESKRGAPE